jgi:hypothetical protein
VGLPYIVASDSLFMPQINARYLDIEDHVDIHNHRSGYDQKEKFKVADSEMVRLLHVGNSNRKACRTAGLC